MNAPMNVRMIGILVRKDLQLVAIPVLGYLLAGLVAVGLIALPQSGGFYAGAVMLITVLMALGFHPAMATVVSERKDQTLAFALSLPITPRDYTVAKLLLNQLVFFVPWTVMLLASAAVILQPGGIGNGMLVYASLLFGVIATSAVIILCVAIVTESMQLTIGVQVASNMVFQAVMYHASHEPLIQATMNGDAVLWSRPALLYWSVYLAIMLLAIATMLWRQARKTSFI